MLARLKWYLLSSPGARLNCGMRSENSKQDLLNYVSDLLSRTLNEHLCLLGLLRHVRIIARISLRQQSALAPSMATTGGFAWALAIVLLRDALVTIVAIGGRRGTPTPDAVSLGLLSSQLTAALLRILP